jgi:very-short-patch-repair endonuclease
MNGLVEVFGMENEREVFVVKDNVLTVLKITDKEAEYWSIWKQLPFNVDKILQCESPIERLLYYELDGAILPEMFIAVKEYFGYEVAEKVNLVVIPQQSIPPYRVDFYMIAVMGPETIFTVVECDGHDFHEKTKEQAQRDKQRDRYFTSKGYKVVHFTGSEIWKDASKCASEIADIIINEFNTRCRRQFLTTKGETGLLDEAADSPSQILDLDSGDSRNGLGISTSLE